MSEQAFLKFVAARLRLPSGGLRALSAKIHIKRVGKPESVPHAHTCSLTLDLPPYTSRAQLKRQLRLAFELMSKFEGLVD